MERITAPFCAAAVEKVGAANWLSFGSEGPSPPPAPPQEAPGALILIASKDKRMDKQFGFLASRAVRLFPDMAVAPLPDLERTLPRGSNKCPTAPPAHPEHTTNRKQGLRRNGSVPGALDSGATTLQEAHPHRNDRCTRYRHAPPCTPAFAPLPYVARVICNRCTAKPSESHLT